MQWPQASIAHLRVSGCLAYALVPVQQRRKLDNKAVKCIFVGYSSKSKGYRLYHPKSKRILVSQDVVLWKMQFNPYFHVLRRQILAHGICMKLCYLFSVVRSQQM